MFNGRQLYDIKKALEFYIKTMQKTKHYCFGELEDMRAIIKDINIYFEAINKMEGNYERKRLF